MPARDLGEEAGARGLHQGTVLQETAVLVVEAFPRFSGLPWRDARSKGLADTTMPESLIFLTAGRLNERLIDPSGLGSASPATEGPDALSQWRGVRTSAAGKPMTRSHAPSSRTISRPHRGAPPRGPGFQIRAPCYGHRAALADRRKRVSLSYGPYGTDRGARPGLIAKPLIVFVSTLRTDPERL